MRMREDVKTLTGPDKAALLLMAVGEENASRLFSMMEDEEIRELSQHMATLGSASSDLIEHLLGLVLRLGEQTDQAPSAVE